MRHLHGPNCGCPVCVRRVVHPVKQNTVHCCSEEVVEHIHPSHTTVVNHHLIKNKHLYPHSTSYENTCNSVNEYGGACNVPGKGHGHHVGGAMYPGMNYPHGGYGMPHW